MCIFDSNMKRIIPVMAFVLALLVMSGCHSSRTTVRGSQAVTTQPPPEQPKGRNEQIVATAMAWLGTPYKYGGNDREGVDCSGLTCAVYLEATGTRLPRNSAEQASWCRRTPRSKLRPGDLIFFTSKPKGNRINHVALYIGDNRVIHATTSRGVVISDLDETYWKERLKSCGRVE